MNKIILKNGKEQKIINFYPNIYKDDIKEIIGNVKNGDIVDINSSDMSFIARGYINEGTSSFVRVLTTVDEKIDKDFIFKRIKDAYEKRKNLLNETNSARIFFSEADFIPGLIIDKFDKYISIQFRNSGIEKFKEEILNAIKKIIKPLGVYQRNDVESRVYEGAETNTEILYGNIPERIVMNEKDLKYYVDIINGQKTGFFLDQRDSRAFIENYINENTNFLDVFSNSGAFSMLALKKGANKVTAIDKDPYALKIAKENYELNNFSKDFFCIEGDAFHILKTLATRNEKFDIITLDPPTLIKKRNDVYKGRDFFIELCDNSFKILKNNGILGIISCSYYISIQDLIETARIAASKNKKILKFLGINYQPQDHPWILHIPESLYLKALWVKIEDR